MHHVCIIFIFFLTHSNNESFYYRLLAVSFLFSSPQSDALIILNECSDTYVISPMFVYPFQKLTKHPYRYPYTYADRLDDMVKIAAKGMYVTSYLSIRPLFIDV
jgi:hypothetical protein